MIGAVRPGEVDEAAPTVGEVRQALQRAVAFFHSRVARHGGYVWKYSSDLQYRQGEGLAYDQRIWVQPPGTPAVGMALLDAHEATGDPLPLQAARDAAEALVRGQLHSGGWHYSVTFDPRKRRESHDRLPPTGEQPDVHVDPDEPGGWTVWKKRRHPGNMTILDDDTTTSALRFLMRLDRVLTFEDERIHEAVRYGLESLRKAQYPNGAWSHNYDRFPRRSPDPDHYPVKKASFPDSWSRTWSKDFAGCYSLNDRITLNGIRTMFDAHDIYGRPEYLDSARRGGKFLLLAQLPQPQPAWAQQYDRHMHPVWDRSFEPPAVTGLESQDVLETLLLLYRRTGETKYLDAVSRALVYLHRSRLDDGKLARFYELETNRPLYFTSDYKLTDNRDDVPEHYRFLVNSRLDGITLHYRLLAHEGPDAQRPPPTDAELEMQTRRVLDSMDRRGAWLEPGFVRDPQGRKVEPENGIIRSRTFIDNVRLLCRFLETVK